MIVVTDTSVVLNLCWLRQEGLLASIFQQVIAPEEVRVEFERKAATDERFFGLKFPPFISVTAPQVIPPSLADNPDLDPGEIAALALALELGIADILMDEQSGRAVALSLGLRVSGLLGVLIEAKHRGLTPELRPLLERLVSGARFWISPNLRAQILLRAGESSDS